MLELVFLIPLVANSHRHFSPKHHKRFERLLLDLFGGWTREGPVIGAWRDGHGVDYCEPSFKYKVKLDSIIHGNAVGEAALFALSHYEQHAIALLWADRIEILSEDTLRPDNAVALKATTTIREVPRAA